MRVYMHLGGTSSVLVAATTNITVHLCALIYVCVRLCLCALVSVCVLVCVHMTSLKQSRFIKKLFKIMDSYTKKARDILVSDLLCVLEPLTSTLNEAAARMRYVIIVKQLN